MTSYDLVLNSDDKTSGNNNNCTFDINFDTFLDRNVDKYQVKFSFTTIGGFYKDGAEDIFFNNAYIKCNLQGRTFNFNSNTSSPDTTIGFIQRDSQTTTTTTNVLKCNHTDNPPITIIRPTQNLFTIQIYNIFGENLLVNTNEDGDTLENDMTDWMMIMNFTPITE